MSATNLAKSKSFHNGKQIQDNRWLSIPWKQNPNAILRREKDTEQRRANTATRTCSSDRKRDLELCPPIYARIFHSIHAEAPSLFPPSVSKARRQMRTSRTKDPPFWKLICVVLLPIMQLSSARLDISLPCQALLINDGFRLYSLSQFHF